MGKKKSQAPHFYVSQTEKAEIGVFKLQGVEEQDKNIEIFSDLIY